MTYDFGGKVALVTGGGSGIGAAAARGFAAGGATVVISDLQRGDAETVCAAIREGGGAAETFIGDVSDAATVAQMMAMIEERCGGLNIAVNNAGIGGAQGPLHEMDEDDFDRVIAVNLKAVWLCMRGEVKLMLKRGGGAIVNTASALARVGLAGSAHYTASKHGVAGLTKVAALDYAGHGIRVNAVCPGVITTPLTAPSIAAAEGAMIGLHPLGRLGTPEEAAAAILWLASSDASFATGSLLTVDGGWNSN